MYPYGPIRHHTSPKRSEHGATECLAFRWFVPLSCLLWVVMLGLTWSAPALAAPDNLRVVSYNVWGVPHISPKRAERIVAIAQRLAELDADVVALQEVWEDEDVAVLSATLRDAGLLHQRRFGVAGAEANKSGLWLASRHPIVRERFTPYAAGREILFPWHLDWMATKGFAVVQLETGQGVVAVANTHLQSAYRFYDYQFTRLDQALQLSASLPRQAPDMPLFMVGDFNDAFDSLPLRALGEGARLTSASDTFGIDGVLARPGARVAPKSSRVQLLWEQPLPLPSGEMMVLSDHPCVVVDYAMDRCEDCGAAGIGPAAAGSSSKGRFSQQLVTALSDERRITRWGIWLFRGAAAFSLLGAWLGMRRRWFRRRWLRRGLVLALLLFAGWSANVGWVWAPAKEARLAHHEQALRALSH